MGPPACLVSDMRPDTGDVSPRVLRLVAVMACPLRDHVEARPYLPHARGSTSSTIYHPVRPREPHVPAAGTVESTISGSGEAGPLSQGSGEAALASLGSGETEPILRWSGEVARALLLGLVFRLSCFSFQWAVGGHEVEAHTPRELKRN
jgi:hypothetical protein